ncbi:origin recognition complex subunit 5 C-terminus-domain-containing protein [Flagelloscypha sp. PMI_526]|nr:origin recognition complex subunit 5 C-terminus-domain-containing protein [Flagelloscypha sp. PMI_526]
MVSDIVAAAIETCPPPFIFINDPLSPALTARAIESSCAQTAEHQRIRTAHLSAVNCFTTRLFYDTALNSFANWMPDWDNDCQNWGTSHNRKFNDSFDSFLHGLATLDAEISSATPSSTPTRYIVTIENAERLRDNLPELVVPLTRLAELSRLDVCVIFISVCRWEDLHPSLGASPDPLYLDVPPAFNDDIHDILCSEFERLCQAFQHGIDGIFEDTTVSPFNPVFIPLYSSFADAICTVGMPTTRNPEDILYVASTRWPGFVKPILDEYEQRLAEYQAIIEGTDQNMSLNSEVPRLEAPSELVRMRLLKLFTGSISAAFDDLHPRKSDATTWAREHVTPDNLLSMPFVEAQGAMTMPPPSASPTLGQLPQIYQYILVASYIASTNPQRTDLRMFGRGVDEKKRKPRSMKIAGTTGAGSKIGQHLQGPSAFPLDRMIAILGALLEENDADSRPKKLEFKVPGEYTDSEIGRTSILAIVSLFQHTSFIIPLTDVLHHKVTELTRMKLLHRTSQADRLDGPPQYKCGISFDITQSLARGLRVQLQDILYHPM